MPESDAGSVHACMHIPQSLGFVRLARNVGLEPYRRAAGELSSPVSTFCADSSFGIRSTPVLRQQHVTDPGHSAKSAGGRLQLNTHTPYVCGFA